MARLDTLLSAADRCISERMSGGMDKNASAKVAAEDDDIFKLAEQVRTPETPAPSADDSAIKTLTEKVAHALAITELVMNLPVIEKMQNLEKTARAKGCSEEEISQALEKVAGKEGKLRSVLKLLPFIGGSAAIAGTSGAVLGERKGEQKGEMKGVSKGYVQALKDVDDAWTRYSVEP